MALIAKDQNATWVFIHGKHQGRTLQVVAEEDPSYLQWMYSKASDGLDKEAFYALEDIMEENDIDIP
mgnify:CR=1 FL=1